MLSVLALRLFEYNATFRVPFANVSYPLYVAYDEANNREKISFFNDADYTIWNGFSEPGVYDYKQIITYFDNAANVSKQQCLIQPTYTGFDNAVLMPMLPNLEEDGFELLGEVTIFDKTYKHYERHVIDTPAGDIPISIDDPSSFVNSRDDYQNYYCEQVGEICVPYKWEFYGRNTLFGSHYDYYVLEVHSFNANPTFNDDMFKVTMQCTASPIVVNPTRRLGRGFLAHLMGKAYRQNMTLSKNVSFLTAPNRFADMPHEEMLAMRTGYRKSMLRYDYYKHNLTAQMKWPEMTSEYYVDSYGRKISFPKRVDWRVRSGVTSVRDQCFCGSCWAFGTAAAIESRLNLLYKDSLRPFVQISEYAMVDCLWTDEMMGCDGGEADIAIDRMIDMFGGKLPNLADYPYLGQNMKCQKDKWTIDDVYLRGFFNTEPNNDLQLMYALLDGPLTIAIAVPPSMTVYAGGIYDDPECAATTVADLSHQVTLVGYDISDDGSKYWIVKNSWSNLWGADGYIYIKFGYCGVTLMTTGAVLEKVN